MQYYTVADRIISFVFLCFNIRRLRDKIHLRMKERTRNGASERASARALRLCECMCMNAEIYPVIMGIFSSSIWIKFNCTHFRFVRLENMDIILKTKTHLYEKDGHVFYNITGTQVDYTLDGLKLRLDNLFDGVKVLGM